MRSGRGLPERRDPRAPRTRGPRRRATHRESGGGARGQAVSNGESRCTRRRPETTGHAGEHIWCHRAAHLKWLRSLHFNTQLNAEMKKKSTTGSTATPFCYPQALSKNSGCRGGRLWKSGRGLDSASGGPPLPTGDRGCFGPRRGVRVRGLDTTQPHLRWGELRNEGMPRTSGAGSANETGTSDNSWGPTLSQPDRPLPAHSPTATLAGTGASGRPDRAPHLHGPPPAAPAHALPRGCRPALRSLGGAGPGLLSRSCRPRDAGSEMGFMVLRVLCLYT